MEAGEVSTTTLGPNCHLLVVSSHLGDVGVNPAKRRLLVRQPIVATETRLTWRRRPRSHEKPFYQPVRVLLPVLRKPSAAVL